MKNTEVHISVSLNPIQALALAQWLKRYTWSDIQPNAADDDEAYLMREGLDTIRTELAAVGYNPR